MFFGDRSEWSGWLDWSAYGRDKRIWIGLMIGYAFCLPFVSMWSLPIVQAKIQPTELIFLLFLPAALMAVPGVRPLLSDRLVWWVGLFVGSNFLAAGSSGEWVSLYEAAGRGYLAVLFLVVGLFVQVFGRRAVDWILIGWTAGGLLMAVMAIFGFGMACLGYPNRLVDKFADYPYLGTIWRSIGLAGGAGSLLLVLIVPFLVCWQYRRQLRLAWLSILILGLAVALTVSKEILLVPMALLWLGEPGTRRARWVRSSATVVVILTYTAGTHILVTSPGLNNPALMRQTEFSSDVRLGRIGPYDLYGTSYYALKKAALFVASDHPWLGVGPGGFIGQLPDLQESGQYPDHLPEYEPHSTWLGALAELGLLGFTALTCLGAMMGGRLYGGIKRHDHDKGIQVLVVFVFFLLVVSISMDILNFRYLWVSLGALLGLSLPSRLNWT